MGLPASLVTVESSGLIVVHSSNVQTALVELDAQVHANGVAIAAEALARASAVTDEAATRAAADTANANAITSEAATARAAESTNAAAAAAAQSTASAALPKAGGTMVGDIVLAHDAPGNLNPVTLQQVNALISAALALLVGGADTFHDTLVELQNLLNTDESTAAALATTVAGKLAKASNLSDLTNAVTARTNLGLGTAATHPVGDFAQTANNLSDVTPATSRTNLGLGSVDNTSDANKPVSTAQQTALNLKVPTSRALTAGTGLTGGGDLSADRSLAVAYGTAAGTAAQGNDSRITGAEQAANKGAASGYMGLDASSRGAQTPKLHASTHASGGSDVLTPAAILAAGIPDIQVFTVSGTWAKPTGGQTVAHILCVGSGGPGGSGARGTTGTVHTGGGGGSASGISTRLMPFSLLSSNETVTVGTVTAGGVAQTVNSTAGNAGAAASPTSFGSHVRCGGGNSGSGGAITGVAAAGGIAGNGGSIGGIGGASSATGGNGTGGSPGGYGASGGAGGGLTAANAIGNGGNGASSGVTGGSTLGAGGSGDGASGSDGVSSTENGGGGGGGGGAASAVTTGGKGGNGGSYGAGGGGGGASINGFNSGAGGDGAAGICIVISW